MASAGATRRRRKRSWEETNVIKRFQTVSILLFCVVLAAVALVSCGKGEPAKTEVAGGVDAALIERFSGDWNGCVAFVDGTGKYESLTGTVGAVARILVDDKGAVTPFIGLDVEDTPIEDLTAAFTDTGLTLSGKWISADFRDVAMTEKGGTLSTRISVSKEAGSVTLVFNFRRLDDTGWTDENPGFSESQINTCKGKTFDELAEMIGYRKSDYPAASSEPAAAEDKPASTGSIIGSWVYAGGGYTYTFNADGSGSYSAGSTVMEFTYEDLGGKVKILYKGNTMASEYGYTVSGNTLSIEDSFGDKVEYTKK